MNGKFAQKKQAAIDNTGARSITHGLQATGFIKASLSSFELATSQQLHAIVLHALCVRWP